MTAPDTDPITKEIARAAIANAERVMAENATLSRDLEAMRADRNAAIARAEQAEERAEEWHKAALGQWELADSTAMRVLKAERDAALARERALQARVAELEGVNNTLRTALDLVRTKDREPDFCYDYNWEYTMGWDQWPDLVDGADLTEPMPIYTLYKGPTKWAVEIHELNTDGDIDDSEVKIFDTEEAARAALSREGGESKEPKP